MKTYYIAGLLAFLFFTACKTEPKKTETAAETTETEKTVPERIAEAHGFEHWKDVERITFTFNVDRDSMHFERSWDWEPKTNMVTAISGADTLRYDRNAMDSIALKTNGGFINDRYWLMAPFNLMWDANNYTFEHTAEATAPISQEPMQKLTIVYANEGGYTPGDAYDFYFKDDYVIREWAYRKSNQEEPNLVSTWEDYVKMEGLQLAQQHNRPEGGTSLYFTGLSVSTQ
ncbi:MAG: hypothetical protein JJ885_12080 [Muricauda sp.]|jgi:hypothetical protein|nr:hypothetical protein [Allomuricauda sp.]MBO6534428.1 hypothetical protein [Allomuricauda sp.]MBO6589425.1 hypothetical protein [Allomuricauda sp.]MBO6619143.1 hypothetical protein [Allomuricauda sp.]MBO6644962.1 hypothetical protein [Allomuricauda sp.]MBO6747263.1 hypothetical protein [Allomuricauda sp.]